jgi:hypothetical protein
LQQAVLGDTAPDFTELARVIALSLGPDRGVVIEVASPMMPGWWFRI